MPKRVGWPWNSSQPVNIRRGYVLTALIYTLFSMAFLADMLSYVGWVLLAIMILVFVHELGHFLFAKLFKMRVDKFSVGFPPKVVGFTWRGTEYVLGLTPLGGYVKIAGMVDESMDTDALAAEPQEYEFRAKPVWQRILVITGGVLFNFILAAVIFAGLKATFGEMYVPATGSMRIEDGSIAHAMGLRTGDQLLEVNGRPFDGSDSYLGVQEMLLANPLELTVERSGDVLTFRGPDDIMTQLNQSEGAYGLSFDPAVVGNVRPDSPAERAGLRPGDRIVAVGDSTVAFWSDVSPAIQAHASDQVRLSIFRPDSVGVTPASAFVLPDSLQMAGGILFDIDIVPDTTDGRAIVGIDQLFRTRTFSVGHAAVAGVADTWVNTRLIATSLKRIFTGQDAFRENIGGPVMIARATKEAADRGAPFFWNIVAVLSITLAIINILPIPALDGGHLVFLLYEGITRREPSLKVRMVLQQIGMVILLIFMVFVIFNDFLKL